MQRPYDLPSMTMLRTFEAAARRGAFKEAASEMNVTPGAVSHQVKALEKELGTPLFLRGHRLVELTEEGEQLYHVLRDTFQSMSEAVVELRQRGQENRVTVGATTDVSYLWLTAKIVSFWKEHSDIIINQQLTDRRITRPLSVDVALEYSVLPPSEPGATLLFRDRLMPVCAPERRGEIANLSLEQLAEAPLIHLDMPEQDWTIWPTWFELMGHSKPVPRARFVNNYSVALQMACEGAGIALGWQSLVTPYLNRGELIAPTRFECLAPGGYYLTPAAHFRNPGAQVFIDWMKQQYE